MSIDLKIPEMGESITQVVIGEWLKGEADYVERDEDVVLVESDKATVEIPAPESGKLVKIFKQNGETAAVGEIIGRLESAEWEASETSAAPSNQEGRRTERGAADHRVSIHFQRDRDVGGQRYSPPVS
jgi:2-oxoglutarate dehydrogenase E2 component (dihydrolipoamide succinyltransferase)